MSSSNTSWNLEKFLDSLIVELDKAQDTLSVKGVTRKMTYTVKDMALDMQVFPQYDGKTVKFAAAEAGQSGSSRLSIQLGSITDRQIADHVNKPMSVDDISMEDLDGVDEDTREAMEKMGINSSESLKRMEQNNVNVEAVLRHKVGEKGAVNYQNLAAMINKARRKKMPPSIKNVSMAQSDQSDVVLALDGGNLSIAPDAPVALFNGEVVTVATSSPTNLNLKIDPSMLKENNRLEILLDPYTIITLELKS